MTTDNATDSQYYSSSLDGPALADELARRKGVKPIESADDLAGEGIFDTDQELQEFLEYTRAARQADLA
jgi:hypothetical protein